MRWLIVAAMLSLLTPPVAEAWRGEVLQVITGDVISARYGRGPAHVRLHGIRVPERGQPQAQTARELVLSLIGKSSVQVLPTGGLDRHSRIWARVFVKQLCLNDELLRAGLAWWDREAAPTAERLEQLEAEARAARRGLWANPSSISAGK